jgi:hypothetical protein
MKFLANLLQTLVHDGSSHGGQGEVVFPLNYQPLVIKGELESSHARWICWQDAQRPRATVSRLVSWRTKPSARSAMVGCLAMDQQCEEMIDV